MIILCSTYPVCPLEVCHCRQALEREAEDMNERYALEDK